MNRLFALLLAAGLFVCSISAQTLVVGGPNPQMIVNQKLTSYSSTSALASATIYVSPAGGALFRMCGFSVLSVGATGGSYTLLANWTTAGHSFVGGQMGKSVGNAQWDWNGAGVVQSPCLTFWADGGTNIQFGIGSSATGSPTLQYAWTLERLQ